MGSIKLTARVAGFLYLLITIAGLFALQYVPATLFVAGDATATARNIATHEMLFRITIAVELLIGLLAFGVSLALYQLFRGVDKTQAAMLFILNGIMPAPLYFLNVVNYIAALLLVRGADFLSVVSSAQREALAMLFLRLHHYELMATFVFAGLWLFPFGYLIIKSKFLPRLLGIWLIINGFAYLAIAFSEIVLPQYSDAVATIASPVLFGEIVVMLWLLILGVRPTAAVAP